LEPLPRFFGHGNPKRWARARFSLRVVLAITLAQLLRLLAAAATQRFDVSRQA